MSPSTDTAPRRLAGARLPRWALPADWPLDPRGRPQRADLALGTDGRVAALTPASGEVPDGAWALDGAPVLPGLVDAHTHLDKTFTLERIGPVQPGLLAAIDAMMGDRVGWTDDDVRERAGKALQWACEAGVVRLRTHCDWWEPDAVPRAWGVLRELAADWAGRVEVDRAALIPLHLYADAEQARALARTVAAGGPGARLGGFVHTSNWNPAALRHLLEAAQSQDLDVDLHIDEELDPRATGLAELARLLPALGFEGRVVCGHACALSAQDDATALATLDAVARAPITLVSLPVTNLLLQDAQAGRTPRRRGLTLLKEARARGIPLLIASDNVQDPFCAVGSYDPVEALAAGVLAGQLGPAFDDWSDTICRGDLLNRTPGTGPAGLLGGPADLLLFSRADAAGWPSRGQNRVVLRGGRVVAGSVPPTWTAAGGPNPNAGSGPA